MRKLNKTNNGHFKEYGTWKGLPCLYYQDPVFQRNFNPTILAMTKYQGRYCFVPRKGDLPVIITNGYELLLIPEEKSPWEYLDEWDNLFHNPKHKDERTTFSFSYYIAPYEKKTNCYLIYDLFSESGSNEDLYCSLKALFRPWEG